jgi:hypothetical protein
MTGHLVARILAWVIVAVLAGFFVGSFRLIVEDVIGSRKGWKRCPCGQYHPCEKRD